MDSDYLLRLYDHEYAKTYDEKFVTSELARADAEYEMKLLSQLLVPGIRWLDVACGTGYFLSQFPEFYREGLDLSPAMLDLARQRNTGVRFHERSYLIDNPDWRDHWDLVSCMWYAYGLVDSMSELERLIENLARWTAPGGRCFVPLADPRLIAGVDLPYVLKSPWPGRTSITGILWSYSENCGTKKHAHQIAPHVEYMEELFRRYFETVALKIYPPALAGWEGQRRALVASRKKL